MKRAAVVPQQTAIVGDTRRPSYLTSHIPTIHSYPHGKLSWVVYFSDSDDSSRVRVLTNGSSMHHYIPTLIGLNVTINFLPFPQSLMVEYQPRATAPTAVKQGPPTVK